MSRVIVSFAIRLFSLPHPKDINYEQAGKILEEALAQQISLWTTWDVISETLTLLLYRFSSQSAIYFLDKVKSTLHIIYYDDSVRKEAERIFRLFSRDKKLSFCDAISYFVVKAILKDGACLSFDEDFSRLGLNVIS